MSEDASGGPRCRKDACLFGGGSQGRCCQGDDAEGYCFARLAGRRFDGKDLTGRFFHSCDLRHAVFRDANLLDADFRGSDLRFSDLSIAKYLTVHALSLTNLAHAQVPKDLKLDETVAAATGRSNAVQKTAFSVFGLYAYLVVAALSSSDSGLFVATLTTKLPIVQLDVPTRQFFALSMILVLSAHLYLTSEISGLMNLLRKLPAVLPDGRPIEQALGSWALFAAEGTLSKASELEAYRYLHQGRSALPRPSGVPRSIGRIVAGARVGVIECILGLFGLGAFLFLFLKFQRLHLGIEVRTLFPAAALAVVAGVTASTSKRFRHRRDANPVVSPRTAWAFGLFAFVLALALAEDAALGGLVKGYRPTLLYLLRATVFDPAANLSRRDLSERPANFTPTDPDDWNRVKPFPLRRANLRDVNADSVFMARADAEESVFDGGSFVRADLRRCRMDDASFERVDFTRADLRESELDRIDARGANWTESHLEGADFDGADLSRSVLTGVFASRPFHAPRLGPYAPGTEPPGSEMPTPPWMRRDRAVRLFSRAKMQDVRIDGGSSFNGAIFRHADLRRAKVRDASFCDADLAMTDLRGTRFSRVTAEDADLRLSTVGETTFSACSLPRVAFDGLHALGRASFEESDLERTVWRNLPSTREGALSFSLCDLAWSRWYRVKLANLRLFRCDLSNSRWEDMDLRNVDLTGSRLEDAEFYKCTMSPAQFELLKNAGDAVTSAIVVTPDDRHVGISTVRTPKELSR